MFRDRNIKQPESAIVPTSDDIASFIKNGRVPFIQTFKIEENSDDFHLLHIPPGGVRPGDTYYSLPEQVIKFYGPDGTSRGETIKHWLSDDQKKEIKEIIDNNLSKKRKVFKRKKNRQKPYLDLVG